MAKNEKRVTLGLSDIMISKQERENGIEGIDAQRLLVEMKKIISEAEAK